MPPNRRCRYILPRPIELEWTPAGDRVVIIDRPHRYARTGLWTAQNVHNLDCPQPGNVNKMLPDHLFLNKFLTSSRRTSVPNPVHLDWTPPGTPHGKPFVSALPWVCGDITCFRRWCQRWCQHLLDVRCQHVKNKRVQRCCHSLLYQYQLVEAVMDDLSKFYTVICGICLVGTSIGIGVMILTL